MHWLYDIRSSWRFWSQRPRAAAAAIVLLALGIGACALTSSLAEDLLWGSLPTSGPERLVMLWETPPRAPGEEPAGWRVASYPIFGDWRRELEGLDVLAASRPWRPTLATAGELVSVAGARVTAGFLAALDVEPLLGRGFAGGEDQLGAAPVVVLTHDFWRRRFGGDPEILGTTLALDDDGTAVRAAVIGVLPPEARIGPPMVFEEAEILAPLRPETARGRRHLRVFGRLSAGADLGAVRGHLEALSRGHEASHPRTHAGWGAEIAPLAELVAAPVRPAVRLLLAASGLLFLVALSNVALLLLIHEGDRRRDLALRVVLGAGPARIRRQMLIELLVLGASGAAAGVALAAVVLEGLQAAGLVPGTAGVVDGRGLAVAGALWVVTAAAVGGLCSRRLSRMSLAAEVGAAGVRRPRLAAGRPAAAGYPRRGLVLAEISLAVVLVSAAALMLQSFLRLLRADPGFDARGVQTMRLRVPSSLQPEEPRVEDLWRRLPAVVESLPQVHSAGLVNYLPMQGTRLGTRAWAAGADPREGLRVEVRGVSQSYFSGLGVPLLAGRDVAEADVAEDRAVAVVSEAAARRLWPPDGRAVGRRLHLDWRGHGAREVVGIVGDVKHHGVLAAADPAVYLPYGQTPHAAMTLVVRSHLGEPPVPVAAVRARLAALDAAFVVDRVRGLRQVVGATLSRPRDHAVALAAFALVAVCLSAGGAYQVVAYSVARRRHDFSVRLALGADPHQLVRGVAAQGLRDGVFGVGVGLILFVLSTQWLSNWLFGARAGDPWLVAAMSLVMVLVAWIAAYLPARKAARIDPSPSLRAA